MNKKMRELLSKIDEKMLQAKAFMDGENKDVDKAAELLDEVEALQKEYEAEKRLFEMEKENNTPSETEEKEVKTMDSVKAFAQAARMGFPKEVGKMSEGVATDGGYTVPEDIQTKINEFRTAKASLLNHVSVEKVSTNKGSRTFKSRATQKGFTKVGEGAKIQGGTSLKFERVNYEIDKYAGYFPVTNELLADSDANIANVLIEWIGDESRVTANKLILEVAKTLPTGTLNKATFLDDLKNVLNVELGAAFKDTSKIYTNDSGLQYLDTLKDNDGKYLLQPNPAEPMKLQLCAGATVVPVEVLPNADLPNDSTKIPFIIGDLKEAIKYWDRQQTSIKVSDTASVTGFNAFEEDLTLYRAIEREDVTLWDKQAAKYCEFDTAGGASVRSAKK